MYLFVYSLTLDEFLDELSGYGSYILSVFRTGYSTVQCRINI